MSQTLFLGQMWKLDGTNLVNKGDLWKSYDNWTLQTTDDETYYIENTSNKRILAIKDTDNTVVSIKNYNSTTHSMWNKEFVNDTNCENYFTLIHPHSVEVLTATTDNRLIVSKGIYAQGKMKLFNILSIFIHFCVNNCSLTLQSSASTDLKTNENHCKSKILFTYHMTKYICWGLVFVLAIMEMLQLLSKVIDKEVWEYFTRQNMIEAIMLIIAIAFFVIQFIEDQSTTFQLEKSGAQEHLLGWALFLAWIDLTIFLARFDVFGKPIYLSWHVLNNVAWSMIVYIPTVIAFSAGFHCFLKSNAVFEGRWSSIIKTLTMLLGEYDFEDNFLYDAVNKNMDSNFSVQVGIFSTDTLRCLLRMFQFYKL